MKNVSSPLTSNISSTLDTSKLPEPSFFIAVIVPFSVTPNINLKRKILNTVKPLDFWIDKVYTVCQGLHCLPLLYTF